MSKDITDNIEEIENNIDDIQSESEYNDFWIINLIKS
jgi:hypothetical protein